jgi:hypothetical protein
LASDAVDLDVVAPTLIPAGLLGHEAPERGRVGESRDCARCAPRPPKAKCNTAAREIASSMTSSSSG